MHNKYCIHFERGASSSFNELKPGNLRNATGSEEKKPFSYIDAGVAQVATIETGSLLESDRERGYFGRGSELLLECGHLFKKIQ